MAACRGQLTRARDLARQFETEASATGGLKGAATLTWSSFAQFSAQVGQAAQARAEIRHALELNRNVNTVANAAITMVLLGDLPEARRMIDEAKRDLPPTSSDEIGRAFATLDALYRLRAGDKSAVDAVPPPRDERDIGERATLGLANLELGNAEAAAARFKEILDDKRPSVSTDVALAPLYYGRALAKLGRADEARAAYERFFTNWKNADADLPLLVSAKQEYSRLQKS